MGRLFIIRFFGKQEEGSRCDEGCVTGKEKRKEFCTVNIEL